MELADYYMMILHGEDFDSIWCPAEYRDVILRFRRFGERTKFTYKEVGQMTGLNLHTIRLLRAVYFEFTEKKYFGKPLPKPESKWSHPESWKKMPLTRPNGYVDY